MLTAPGLDEAAASSASDDDAWFEAWRARELSRVERADVTYLDSTGAVLYPESLVRHDADRLAATVLGNPHSEHGPSRASTQCVADARHAILAFLNADPATYTVVLTPNASGACRLVGEGFPFDRGSAFILSADNHNSVNGLREYARARGATVGTLPLTNDLRLLDPIDRLGRAPHRPSLVAWPAQSTFSGVRHPLHLIAEARSRGWRVLLDAASYLTSADLDLSRVAPDFVCLSLYKIAGYPTGIGALVARHDALAELRRPAFAGGTVEWVSVAHHRHRLARGAEGFEDGTTPFLSAGAVPMALGAMRSLDRPRLARHLGALTSRLLEGLISLRHAGGLRVVELHGPDDAADRGPTVAMSIVDRQGRWIPYWQAESAARERGLAVRGGCFCNPGCAESAFAFDKRNVLPCLDALGADFTIPRFAGCLGDAPVGAIRVSLGPGSVRRDVERWLAFVEYLSAID
jgi:selenocysteine lyase/cysteine desulfurase